MFRFTLAELRKADPHVIKHGPSLLAAGKALERIYVHLARHPQRQMTPEQSSDFVKSTERFLFWWKRTKGGKFPKLHFAMHLAEQSRRFGRV